MAKLVWDETGNRFFESGVSKGVLFVQDEEGDYTEGVAWNGLTSVNESPSGAEPTSLWADNIKYATIMSAEEFGCTIEAYTYPDEFAACCGEAEMVPGVIIGQQNRKVFGLAYRTNIGNDVDGLDHAYKLHLVYGALAKTSEKAYETINDSPDAITFSWEATTTPVEVEGHKPVSLLTIDSRTVDSTKLAAFEEILYGSDTEESTLPLPAAVAAAFAETGGGGSGEGGSGEGGSTGGD